MELQIVKYIREKGLKKAVETFKLSVKEYPHKILLKYKQIESDMSLTEVQECRGLVLEKGTWKIMSMSFYKFFNAAEGHAAKIDWDSAHILEKLDGCCDEDTVLETEDGKMTIKEICESKYNGKVKAFNHETNEITYTDIIGHSIKKNNNDWYEIELEEGISIKLTGNHKVYLPELNCYRRVEDLEGNEYFLLEKLD